MAQGQPTLISIRGLTKLHSAAKHFDEAFKVLDTALTKDKPQPEFWIGIADLYRDTGLAAKSKISDIKTGIIAALDKANALKPESPLTIHRLADYYKLWGENEKAIRLFVSLIELSPSLVGVREQLAELYLREEKTEDATKQLEAILRSRPTNERALFVLGGIKRDLDKLDEAAAHFETVLKINPKFEPAYYELPAYSCFRTHPKTLETLIKADKQFKATFINRFYAGLAHSSLHQFSRAIENLLEAEELAQAGEQNRLTHFFYFQLGAAYERNRQYDTGGEDFQQSHRDVAGVSQRDELPRLHVGGHQSQPRRSRHADHQRPTNSNRTTPPMSTASAGCTSGRANLTRRSPSCCAPPN